MPHPPIDRRQALTFGAAGALGLLSAPRLVAAPQEARDARNPILFSAIIPGCLEASKNIREIAIDEFNIDPPRVTGRDNDFWTVGPGDVHLGSARFTITGSPGATKELQAWFQLAAKGGNIRKNITVNLRRADNKTERTFNLIDCFPTAYSIVNFDTSSTVQTETLTVNIGRIEFKT
jgi:hypothetical protein